LRRRSGVVGFEHQFDGRFGWRWPSR
jgi:hypothetical protein